MDISEYGSIFIQLNERYFSAGQQVNGTIILNVIRPIDKASSLALILAGTENTSLAEPYRHYFGVYKKGTPRKYNLKWRRWTETKEICQYRFPVIEFPEQRVEAGMYTFPFSFHLNQEVPSSFEGTERPFMGTSNIHDCIAKVEYSLMALIETPDKTPLVKYLQKVTVNQIDVTEFGMHKAT